MSRLRAALAALTLFAGCLGAAAASAEPEWALVPNTAFEGNGEFWDVGSVEARVQYRDVTLVNVQTRRDGVHIWSTRLHVNCYWPLAWTLSSATLDATGAATGEPVIGVPEYSYLTIPGTDRERLRIAVCSGERPAQTYPTFAAAVAAVRASTSSPYPDQPSFRPNPPDAGRAPNGPPRFDISEVGDGSEVANIVDWSTRWREGDQAGAVVYYAVRRRPEHTGMEGLLVISMRGMRYDCARRTSSMSGEAEAIASGQMMAFAGSAPEAPVRPQTAEHRLMQMVCGNYGEVPGTAALPNIGAAYRDFIDQPIS